MPGRILIVDDDALMRRSLTLGLEQAGYTCQAAPDADTALRLSTAEPPDLVLLDINMPGTSGLEALRQFRERLNIPVIMVSARRRELDEVLGLELGAEDYITKPFSPDVLLARVRAHFRRLQAEKETGPASKPAALQVGDLEIDPASHTVRITGAPVTLSAREFNILYELASNAGNVVSMDDLLDRVWGEEYGGEPQAVYVYIRWLREKLEEDPQNPQRIVTVRRVGYRLVPRLP